MAHRPKLTAEKLDRIFEEISVDSNVSRSCKACGISRSSFYQAARTDPAIKERLDEAIQIGTDAGIDECARRAFAGVDEPIFYQGEIAGTKKVYSDVLAMFLIKGRRPEYRDRMIDLPADTKRFSLTIDCGTPPPDKTQE